MDEPRSMSRGKNTHALAVLEIPERAPCSAPDCEALPVCLLPVRVETGIDIYWLCVEHAEEAVKSKRLPMDDATGVPATCGAPAAPYPEDTACDAHATHFAVLSEDGVTGLRTLGLCERHAGEVMEALP